MQRNGAPKPKKGSEDLRQFLSKKRRKEIDDGCNSSTIISYHQRRGRKPRALQIHECFFPGCTKKYHPNIIFFKNHLITSHLREKIENHITEYSKVYKNRDPRECPFQPCGFYASFK